jgi:hypothetical protein
MAGNFIAGDLVPWTFAVKGKVGGFILNVKETSFDISVLLHDVTGVKALGLRARIAGPTDLAARIVLDLDMDEAPIGAAVGINAGVSGLMFCGLSQVFAQSVQLPLICEKLHIAGSTEKELMWDADWKGNSLAGALVYPALP